MAQASSTRSIALSGRKRSEMCGWKEQQRFATISDVYTMVNFKTPRKPQNGNSIFNIRLIHELFESVSQVLHLSQYSADTHQCRCLDAMKLPRKHGFEHISIDRSFRFTPLQWYAFRSKPILPSALLTSLSTASFFNSREILHQLKGPHFKVKIVLSFSLGYARTIRCARPSTIAVLPTPYHQLKLDYS